MSDDFKPKVSFSDENIFSSFSIGDNTGRTNCSVPCEVFRNNTTAVEVIIKEIAKNKKKPAEATYPQDVTIKKLEAEVIKLKVELKQTNGSLEKARKGYTMVLNEMKKQLETANERDMESRTKNLALQLENEKLKCLLDSKTKFIDKLKRELASMKRLVKCVIKGICNSPEMPDSVSYNSELEYEDFENELSREVKMKIGAKLFDGTRTFDSNVSKEARNSFGKPPF